MVYGGGNFTPVVPQGFDAFGRWFDWAFKRFLEKWQVWLIQGLITMAFTTVLIVAYFVYFFGFLLRSGSGQPSAPEMGQFFAAYGVVMLFTVVISCYLMAGMLNTAMKQAHGEEITVGDLFSGGRMTLPLVGASLVVFIPYIIGVYLCVIPGLVWLAFTWLTIPLVVTRRMGVFEAVSASMAIARQNFWLIALYGLVGAMLSGMLAFLTLPALSLLQMALIADIYGLTNYDRGPLFPGSIPPPPTSYGPPQGTEPPPPPPVGSDDVLKQ